MPKETMTIETALSYVADAYTFISVERAREVCAAFGVEFREDLREDFQSQKDANPDNDPKGLFLNKDAPTSGVSTSSLGHYLAQKIVGNTYAASYFGRGRNARALADSIRAKLGLVTS